MKFILKMIKRIVFSSFLLYCYNLLVGPLNFIIPINIITITAISVFGIPAMIGFIFVYLVVY